MLKCSLLLFDLFSNSVDVGITLRRETVPLRFQLYLRALPGSLASFCLFLDAGLKLAASLRPIGD